MILRNTRNLEYRNYSMNCVIYDDEFTFTIPDGASVMYA